jgi:hypothetical protein
MLAMLGALLVVLLLIGFWPLVVLAGIGLLGLGAAPPEYNPVMAVLSGGLIVFGVGWPLVRFVGQRIGRSAGK